MCFIQIRFLSLAFCTEPLQLFCIYKMHSELLIFYSLVLIFISHSITQDYLLIGYNINISVATTSRPKLKSITQVYKICVYMFRVSTINIVIANNAVAHHHGWRWRWCHTLSSIFCAFFWALNRANNRNRGGMLLERYLFLGGGGGGGL
jgi:hypothetical protein